MIDQSNLTANCFSTNHFKKHVSWKVEAWFRGGELGAYVLGPRQGGAMTK